MTARLKEQYAKEVIPALTQGVRHRQRDGRAPRSRRSSLNMGLGEAIAEREDPRRRRSTSCPRSPGQKAVVTQAKKSIATFKLRDGHADRRAR